MNTNWSNTWKHARYCAFMYTFTEKHVCFHVIYYLVLTFDPTGKGSIANISAALYRIRRTGFNCVAKNCILTCIVF